MRVTELTLVTTLLDSQAYPKPDVSQAYRHRRDSELDLRSIKSVMQMDVLRCKTPAMVRKETGMHLLAYNVIRTVMAESAAEFDREPREIGFKETLQALNAFRPTVILATPQKLPVFYNDLLVMIAEHDVRERAVRVEPRAVKRRSKPHKLLADPGPFARRRCSET